MKFSLGAAVFGVVVLAASACGSSHPTVSPPTNGPFVSSSRVILGGTVRCTATVRTPVQAGHELGIAFRFHNLSMRTAYVDGGWAGMWTLVRSPDGTTYDTRVPLEGQNGPPVSSMSIPPGATKTDRLRYLRVHWEGPLRVTPGCGPSALSPVQVAVASPGLPRSPQAAVTEVVAATRHLLDHCRPRTSGVSVVGRIDPPSGDAPPLQARCSITLHREGNFYRAQVLVVTPPNLRGAAVSDPYERLSPVWQVGDRRNAQVLGWEFVVTRTEALSVDAANTAETRPRGWAPEWIWGLDRGGSGGSACGFQGGGGGGVNGPDVSFVSACGR